ncbi:MAG: aldo/keto reductase, partial [Chloroflexi bacterium]|nr:aldo/keto reductase [Chloroflexota bacterium]
DPSAYIVSTFINTGVARAEDFTQGGQHCITPRYLAHQLAQSRANLQLDALDLYYLHNPEGQLGDVSRDEFRARMRAAFEYLERAVTDGHIARYGVATWTGFRQIPSARDYLSLSELVQVAREVGGEAHHFKAIQLPINLALPEALEHKNQNVNGAWLNVLDAAREFGLMVFASASLLQGRLARNLPGALRKSLGAEFSDAQRALQFTRSLPGVTCALVGMSRPRHVEENLSLAGLPRFSAEQLKRAVG